MHFSAEVIGVHLKRSNGTAKTVTLAHLVNFVLSSCQTLYWVNFPSVFWNYGGIQSCAKLYKSNSVLYIYRDMGEFYTIKENYYRLCHFFYSAGDTVSPCNPDSNTARFTQMQPPVKKAWARHGPDIYCVQHQREKQWGKGGGVRIRAPPPPPTCSCICKQGILTVYWLTLDNNTQ